MSCTALPQLRKVLSILAIALLPSVFTFGQNPILTENALPGTPQSIWDANEGGPIEGFAQEFSINKGQTVHFKINIESGTLVPFTVKIYRIGWYQGNGARFIADLGNSLTGKKQPSYNYEAATGKVDCSNWTVSAQWNVPLTAVSGVYVARFDCPDVGGSSIQQFVVRDDAANSPILFKTSDATWQAYNTYGGNTFYAAATPVPGYNHATKVSYQRPLYIRGDKTCFFNSEYPMIRWLERNGYNMSYATDIDMARDASVFTPSVHKVILSVGHDEYYSLEQRTKLENARANGVHVAFFSGNEMYWKTRWEDNYQTLVCYKEGTEGANVCGFKCDPLPNVWTGLWRAGCPPEYAPNDGCKPEGPFSGQMSWTQSFGSIKVPDTYRNFRFWKNTSIATLGAGQTATMPYGTLGSEWDPEQLTETYPAHRIVLSKTIQTGLTHKMSLYRYSSGALIFSAGTMNWAWGLDDKHDNGNLAPSRDMQQATVNLLYDMGMLAGSLQPDLIAPTLAPDVLAPGSTIISPTHNAVMPGSSVTISGTSIDNGNSTVAGVEISIDNGATWNIATGLENWSYTFSPSGYGTRIIKVRAWDDLGNVETVGFPGTANCISISFSGPFQYSVFNSTYPTAPPVFFEGGTVELGMKFLSTVPGLITGFRYYKAPGVTGVHTGHLWNKAGTLLATKVFSNETSSGWQSVSLTDPVVIDANTTYIVSYFSASGNFAKQDPFFTQAIVNNVLRGLANGEDGGNGVYIYSDAPAFPNNSSGTSNYYADVLFEPTDATAPQVTSVTPANSSTGVLLDIHPSATFNKSIDPATVTTSTVLMRGPGNTPVPGTVSLINGSTIRFIPNNNLAIGSLYKVSLRGGLTEPTIKDLLGNPLASDYAWSFTTGTATEPVITTQPVSQTVCANNTISFSSTATGIPGPAVQWQKSTDNGNSWINIQGANSTTYTFTVLPADNNNQYRAAWSNSVNVVYSNAAVLTVSGTVSGTLSAVNSTVCIGSPMQLQLSSATGVSPYTLTINSISYPGVAAGQPFRPVTGSETIWAPSNTPQELVHADNNAVVVGVKFQANKDGVIRGIRFYKGSNTNGGTHIGSLWTRTGTLLTSATFINETGSGWQEVLFSTPVNITANTTYVASCFLPQGNYSRDPGYFSTSHSNGNSLTALQNTNLEPNAVYKYSSQSTFPDQNAGDPNYWVDVVFAPYAITNTTTTFNLTGITASNGCSVSGNPLSSVTISVSGPVNPGMVTGLSPLCIGSTAVYASNGSAGGNWSSSNPTVATVNTSGIVTALSAGTTNIIYTLNSGCGSPASSFRTLTVDPNANAGTITGISPLCLLLGSTQYASNGNAGGTWSSSNPLVANVNSSGNVFALIIGTTNISYTVNTGCNSPVSSSKTLTVNIIANAGTISGNSQVCVGSTAVYTSNGDFGGEWKSSNTTIATVTPTGIVTGLRAGTVNITYTVRGCIGMATASKTITVKAVTTANAGTISGSSPMCIGGTATYTSNGNAGGVWSSSNPAVATVNSIGKVSGVSPGTTTIVYTVNPVCGNPVSSGKALTVNNCVTGLSQTSIYINSGNKQAGPATENKMLKAEVYPNPAAAEFTLLLTGYSNDKITIIVTDQMGRKVYQSEGDLRQYKFGKNFISGVYLLQVMNGSNKQSLKLIKN